MESVPRYLPQLVVMEIPAIADISFAIFVSTFLVKKMLNFFLLIFCPDPTQMLIIWSPDAYAKRTRSSAKNM